MYSWLDDAHYFDGDIVTSNRRSAKLIREIYGAREIANGRKTWSTPSVLFIGDWLQKLVTDCSSADFRHTKISAQASAVLWEQCYAKKSGDEIPAFFSIIKQCVHTWKRINEWRLPLEEVGANSNGVEQRQFVAAAIEYSNALQENDWMDDATIAGHVVNLIESGITRVPKRATFLGFDRFTPIEQYLISCLKAAGCEVHVLEADSAVGSLDVKSFPDSDAELRAAGAWARRCLSENPAMKLAIISPDLESSSVRVSRMLLEGIAPGRQIAGTSHDSAVDVSFGQPLSTYPAIGIALLLLRWVTDNLSSREVSILLRSRNIRPGPIGGRCRMELQLRQLPDRFWAVSSLLGSLDAEFAGEDAQLWAQSMNCIVNAQDRFQGRKPLSAWALDIDWLLGEVGWQVATAPNSSEFQLLNRWREALNELAQLEIVMPQVEFRTAVSRLMRLAADTIYQPQLDGVILPALGKLEAAGMEFDKIWLVGVDASRWPGSGNPLQFISKRLQRDYDMPDATAIHTLEYARCVLQRIVASADEVVFSWARADDGIEQSLSPLVETDGETTQLQSADPGYFACQLLDSSDLSSFPDNVVPALSDNEALSGGAYTIQRQATDQFSGFAFGRLGVNELPRFQIGISPSMRGSALHKILSILYDGLPSQSEIADWDDDMLLGKIEIGLTKSYFRLERYADETLKRVLYLERDRSRKLVQDFVAQELLRAPFRVAMLEQPLQLNHGNAQLDLRLDRVDYVGENEMLVIDYKTGAEKSLLDGNGELKELQLLIYAMALQGSVAGLAIFNLDSRVISIKKTADDDRWPTQYAAWKEQVRDVIDELVDGEAEVNLSLNVEQGRVLNVLSRFQELRLG